MNRKTPEQKLRELDLQQEKIDKEAKQKKAQIRAAKKRERGKLNAEKKKCEDHKKILVGAMYLDRIKDDPDKQQSLVKLMDKFLTRKQDRDVFGLTTEETE